MMRRNKTGDKYNRLTLIELHASKTGGNLWRVLCDCGTERVVSVRDVVTGHTRSCGCYRKEVMRQKKTSHGGSETAEFRIWSHMLGRCFNPTDHKYGYYGGRGITVCDQWKGSFENFLTDMGLRPSEYHSIDRKDVNGNYEPNNCRWATPHQQAQNKRNNVYVIVDGETVVIAEAERRLDTGKGSLTQRVAKRGETHQQAADHFSRRQKTLRLLEPQGNA